MTTQHVDHQSFEGRTSSFSANPIVATAERIRELSGSRTTPHRTSGPEYDRVTALMENPAFAIRPVRR